MDALAKWQFSTDPALAAHALVSPSNSMVATYYDALDVAAEKPALANCRIHVSVAALAVPRAAWLSADEARQEYPHARLSPNSLGRLRQHRLVYGAQLEDPRHASLLDPAAPEADIVLFYGSARAAGDTAPLQGVLQQMLASYAVKHTPAMQARAALFDDLHEAEKRQLQEDAYSKASWLLNIVGHFTLLTGALRHLPHVSDMEDAGEMAGDTLEYRKHQRAHHRPVGKLRLALRASEQQLRELTERARLLGIGDAAYVARITAHMPLLRVTPAVEAAPRRLPLLIAGQKPQPYVGADETCRYIRGTDQALTTELFLT